MILEHITTQNVNYSLRKRLKIYIKNTSLIAHNVTLFDDELKKKNSDCLVYIAARSQKIENLYYITAANADVVIANHAPTNNIQILLVVDSVIHNTIILNVV
jgi:hypothetical protein